MTRPGPSATLRVAEVTEHCTVLGPCAPGRARAVVWVQGCPLRCSGCISTEYLPFEGGTPMATRTLVDRLFALDGLDGVTFSGGEPFAQAAALVDLVDRLRAAGDWSVMSYTGHTIEWLEARGTPAQRALLDRLDLLVDGPYVERLHRPLLWRGSSNQRIHVLSDRHEDVATRLAVPDGDRPAGIQVEVDGGNFRVLGVPPTPGFRQAFERRMARRGLYLITEEDS